MNQRNIQKQQKLKQKKIEAGLVSERFAHVSGIVIDMNYYKRTMYSKEDQILMIRTLSITPESFAYFDMQCMMKDCGGGFDLTPVVKRLTKKRETQGEGKLVCSGKEPKLPAKHASISYKISITYV